MENWRKLSSIPDVAGPDNDPDIQLDVVVSPYAVPEAVRSRKQRGGRLLIEFRYIDGPEPGTDVLVDEHMSITEGKFSKRLLAIEIDVDAMGATSVGLAISAPDTEAIRSQLHSAWRRLAAFDESDGWNREQVRQAIEPAETELLSSW